MERQLNKAAMLQTELEKQGLRFVEKDTKKINGNGGLKECHLKMGLKYLLIWL